MGFCEGIGKAICKYNNQYYYINLCHGSCCVPFKNVVDCALSQDGYKNIEDLQSHCSDDLKKEIQPLVDYIKSHNLT